MIILDKREQKKKEVQQANLDMILKITEENEKLKILNMVKNIILSLLIGYISIPYLFPDSAELFSSLIIKEAWSLTIDTIKHSTFLHGFIAIVFGAVCFTAIVRSFRRMME